MGSGGLVVDVERDTKAVATRAGARRPVGSYTIRGRAARAVVGPLRLGLAMWPWVVQTAQLGFCDCNMAGWELTCWRCEWIAAGYPSLAW